MDFTSLYANIPHIDEEDACSKFLNDHRVADISTDVMCSLTSVKLKHDNFVFDNHSYLQNSGTAMVRRWRHVLLTFSWHQYESLLLSLLNKDSLTTHHRQLFSCAVN